MPQQALPGLKAEASGELVEVLQRMMVKIQINRMELDGMWIAGNDDDKGNKTGRRGYQHDHHRIKMPREDKKYKRQWEDADLHGYELLGYECKKCGKKALDLGTLRRYPCSKMKVGGRDTRACNAWTQQLENFKTKTKYGKHELYWNGKQKAPMSCLACRFELKSSVFRESWTPSRLKGEPWKWKWTTCKVLSATEPAKEINKKAYLKKHGGELIKPEERGNQVRAEHALAEQRQEDGARRAEGGAATRPAAARGAPQRGAAAGAASSADARTPGYAGQRGGELGWNTR